MDVNYINSFIAGTEDVFNQVAANLELKRQSPYAKQKPFAANAVVSIVGFNGDIDGQVIFVFKQEFAKELVGIMCGGMEITEIDELALSALGEISNMVSGRAVIKLEEFAQKKANITPPTVLYSDNTMNVSLQPPIICIPYNNGSEHSFEVNFALKK